MKRSTSKTSNTSDFTTKSFAVSRGIAASIVCLTMIVGTVAQADVRTPIPRDQASDNILLCRSTGGYIVRTPSVVACCNDNTNGSTTCVGCSPDGRRCATYEVISGDRSDIRTRLRQMAAGGGVVAPVPGASSSGTFGNLLQVRPVFISR